MELPLALGPGIVLGALGSIFGGGQDYGDLYQQQLRGMPQFGGYGGFNAVGLPQLANFGQFGEGDVQEAYRMMRPQTQLALANQRRSLSAANAASAAGGAAGGLSPAAMAAMASRNALGAGLERSGLEAGFAGAATNLALGASQQRLAQTEATQRARFGLFDRAFQQQSFGSEFERQQAIDEFEAEIRRRGLAGDLASQEYEGQGGGIWDFLGGLGTSLAGAGAQGMAFGNLFGQQPWGGGYGGGYGGMPEGW